MIVLHTISSLLVGLAVIAGSVSFAEVKDVPETLQPWQSWVLWNDGQRHCPQAFNDAERRFCVWPSELSLSADQRSGSWTAAVAVFAEAWVPLPGDAENWPLEVLDNAKPVPVVLHEGWPAVKLPPGVHQLEGRFQWQAMPQRISIPPQYGVLSLEVAGETVPLPAWGNDGLVWLKRQRAEQATKDLLAAQMYRVIEDDIPMWLRTEIHLTVSGKSREEELGSVLPEGWQLSTVNSPIPVAVDALGRMKAQVRAGKWVIEMDAFRTSDLQAFHYAENATPVVEQELVAFQAKPAFRIAELIGVQAVDVNQTTFPKKWRDLPVYAWNVAQGFQLDEKMRGMGLRSPEGLTIHRQLWLDNDGGAFTYKDEIQGEMQQIWRLDVADGQELGAVRINGQGQLITANPQTKAHGVEIRNRNLNLVAVGRAQRTDAVLATGWQTSVDSLKITLNLPPGWRVLALFGADSVNGDWLTSWTLLDLFLTLIFALAVYRLWGLKAGLVALLGFTLAYHEPYSPRLSWFFLLMPIALLQVVTNDWGKTLLRMWRNFALLVLLVNLIPFVAQQVQSAIYPQLELSGRTYGERRIVPTLPRALNAARVASRVSSPEYSDLGEQQLAKETHDVRSAGNLALDPASLVQTGPAEPEWSWNYVSCSWSGPVAADQVIQPILLSTDQRRVITAVRIVLLMLLLAILIGMRRGVRPTSKSSGAILLALIFLFSSETAQAQMPDAEMLETLRKRLLESSDAFPYAAEIPSVKLSVEGNRLTMTAEIHAATDVAVPLPGRLPGWSPISVKLDGEPKPVIRRSDGYLWIALSQGVHEVVVEVMRPNSAEWAWTFLLPPRYVKIEAPGWNVSGISKDGIPEKQVFFSRQQELTDDQVAYDQEQFDVVVMIDRKLEAGLVWKVQNTITRLSALGRAVSLEVPLLAGESVLTSKTGVANGVIDVRLGANQKSWQWESELPIGSEILLKAKETSQWVERWRLVTSPVWNLQLTGLPPVFETSQRDLIPTWHPWPGESATLTAGKPEAVEGDTITLKRVQHETIVGSRQRTTSLSAVLECSLATDFEITIDPDVDVTAVKVESQMIPVRKIDNQLVVPTRPGRQLIEITWKTSDLLESVVEAGHVTLPIEAANVTSILKVPRNRWILWTAGPLMGPAVRFWTILIVALLFALILGSVSWSPLRRFEWILLALGLTQVHVFAAMVVVAWLFLLAWRGRLDTAEMSSAKLNFLQLAIVFVTCVSSAILVAVVGEGLLGHPDMFVLGNGSSRTYLQWFQPRTHTKLPQPYFVSISVWYYRLLMLLWALWLAMSLLRWFKWGWQQFTHGQGWKQYTKVVAEGPR